MSNFPAYQQTAAGIDVSVAEKMAFVCGRPVSEAQLLKLQHAIGRAIDLLRVSPDPADCNHNWDFEPEEFGVSLLKCLDCHKDASREEFAEYEKTKKID